MTFVRAASAERRKIRATSVPIDDPVVIRPYIGNPQPKAESRPIPHSIGQFTVKGLGGPGGKAPWFYLSLANNFLPEGAGAV